MCLFRLKEGFIINLNYVVAINSIENEESEHFNKEEFPYLLQFIFSQEIPLPLELCLPFKTKEEIFFLMDEIYRKYE